MCVACGIEQAAPYALMVLESVKSLPWWRFGFLRRLAILGLSR